MKKIYSTFHWKKIAYVVILLFCIIILMLYTLCNYTKNNLFSNVSNLNDIPLDVQECIQDYFEVLLENKGRDKEMEFLYFSPEYEYMTEYYLADNSKTVFRHITSIEKINQDLYSVTFNDVSRYGLRFEMGTATNYVGKIAGQFCYVLNARDLPKEICENLIVYHDENEIMPEEILGPLDPSDETTSFILPNQ